MSEVNRQNAGGSLKRRNRLLRRSQFSRAYELGLKFPGKFMTLWLTRDPEACLRLGVVASKRVGNATQRNRAKRRLRESFRVNRDAFSGPVDVVIVAHRAILRAKWREIESELLRLADTAGILKREIPPR